MSKMFYLYSLLSTETKLPPGRDGGDTVLPSPCYSGQSPALEQGNLRSSGPPPGSSRTCQSEHFLVEVQKKNLKIVSNI